MKCIIKAQFCNQMKSDEIMHIHVNSCWSNKDQAKCNLHCWYMYSKKSVPTKLFYSLKYSAKFWSTWTVKLNKLLDKSSFFLKKGGTYNRKWLLKYIMQIDSFSPLVASAVMVAISLPRPRLLVTSIHCATALEGQSGSQAQFGGSRLVTRQLNDHCSQWDHIVSCGFCSYRNNVKRTHWRFDKYWFVYCQRR